MLHCFMSTFKVAGVDIEHILLDTWSEGTQRFIRVNVYSFSSSSLLATFSEQNKDFFETIILLYDYVCEYVNLCRCI